MKTSRNCLTLIVSLALLGSAFTIQADPTHRYSFTTDASDSVGAANGTINGGVTLSGGKAVFDGVSGSFIDLPPLLISNYNSVTFEFWIDVGVNGNWCELYAFGNRDAGGNGEYMLMFTPHSGAGDFRMSYADVDPGFNHEFVVTQPGVLDNLGPTHIACVYDPTNHFMGLYTNGVLAASRSDLGTFFKLSSIQNVHSWLGQSLYRPDAPYTGSVDEFRIYNQPLNALQIAGSFVGGPDTVSSDPGPVSSLAVTVKNPLVKGAAAVATATADFAKIKGVKLGSLPGLTFTSGNTNIFTVSSNGNVTSKAAGTATLTVSFQGKTATQSINVTTGVATALAHRYSFTTDANDSVGTANGTLQSGAALGGGQVVLDGQGAYVEFPPDMLTNYDSVTFEAWVTDNGSANWARIWDFGDSTGGPGFQGGGTSYMFISLPSGFGNLRSAYTMTGGGAGEQVVEWVGGRPPAGQPVHIVLTTDVAFQTGKLYVNGLLVGINTNMTLTPRDIGSTFNDWLGRSQFNDPYFNGSIDEFRIYNGAITPLQAAIDAATGPDTIVSSPGALKSIQLSIGTNSVVYGGLPITSKLLATYANVTNVNVSSLDGVTFKSSDTNVVTVDALGTLTAANTGNATISAAFGGKTNTLALTVGNLSGFTPATLVHRYSFSDAVGSLTVKDSAGTADGKIAGAGAAFNGKGQLTLPGGTSSAADISVIAGYVDLPNHIINVLTNLSIETWVTWGGSGSWQRIFDFGTSNGGEDVSDGNGDYLFLSTAGPANMRFSVRDPVTGAEPAPLSTTAPLASGQEVYLAVVYNFTANTASLYSNAVVVASGQAPVNITTIDDVNNWLGRSQWGDPTFQGSYDEFRIWNGVLLPGDIATHYAAGPDALTAAPKLTASMSGKNIVLSWPATATGYNLQSTASLKAGAIWTAVQTSPAISNGIATVTIPIGTGTQFFRLSQ